jgi:hypothetical protein
MLVLLSFAFVAAPSSWEVTQKTDPITDKLEVRAALHGDNADIVFMCTRGGDRPVLIYEPKAFLGASGSRYVQYDLRDFVFRFDGAPAQRESWKYLDTYAAPYNQKAAVAFVTRMIQSSRLVIRAERYDHATIDSTFDLAGTPAAFSEAFQACGIRG